MENPALADFVALEVLAPEWEEFGFYPEEVPTAHAHLYLPDEDELVALVELCVN